MTSNRTAEANCFATTLVIDRRRIAVRVRQTDGPRATLRSRSNEACTVIRLVDSTYARDPDPSTLSPAACTIPARAIKSP